MPWKYSLMTTPSEPIGMSLAIRFSRSKALTPSASAAGFTSPAKLSRNQRSAEPVEACAPSTM